MHIANSLTGLFLRNPSEAGRAPRGGNLGSKHQDTSLQAEPKKKGRCVPIMKFGVTRPWCNFGVRN